MIKFFETFIYWLKRGNEGMTNVQASRIYTLQLKFWDLNYSLKRRATVVL